MPYSDETIQQVQEKGKVVSNRDPNIWRKDDAQTWIRREDYGNQDSQYGQDIDHIKPESKGGGDALSNLCPLQWQNNSAEQDDMFAPPVVPSEGDENIEIE